MPDSSVQIEMDFDTAEQIYAARSPWRYDARFHVPRRHIRLIPVFLAPDEHVLA